MQIRWTSFVSKLRGGYFRTFESVSHPGIHGMVNSEHRGAKPTRKFFYDDKEFDTVDEVLKAFIEKLPFDCEIEPPIQTIMGFGVSNFSLDMGEHPTPVIFRCDTALSIMEKALLEFSIAWHHGPREVLYKPFLKDSANEA